MGKVEKQKLVWMNLKTEKAFRELILTRQCSLYLHLVDLAKPYSWAGWTI